MFENLTNRFKDTFNFIGKKPAIDEKDLNEVLREIRLVLLEADVSLLVVKDLIAKIKEDLLGKEIYRSISPKQVILKSVYDSLFNLLNLKQEELELITKPNSFYMLVGLQGVGKTTSVAKIAYHLKNKLQKKVLLASLDLSRPAAYEQLETLCKENELDFFTHSQDSLKKILKDIKVFAKENSYDVILLDTAGRLSIDEELMQEMEDIYKEINPKEVLLVMDSMVGQISLETATNFHNKIKLSGIVVSKADADSRGGAILSCKYITQVPIKFMGVGEKITDLEAFVAKRVVDRILDQGDIISMVEKFQEIEESEVEKMEARMQKGIFNLNDLKMQFKQMGKLGGMSSILGMIPGMSNLKDKLTNSSFDESIIRKHIAIIDSMTKKERARVDILNFSRKQRIVKGSGTTLQDINILLKQFKQMQKMMKKFKGKSMKDIKSLGNLGIDPSKFLK